jgi:DNA-binding NtrC family response regulator
VDDDASIRWALGEALRSWGYETAEGGTVAAGLAAVTARRYRTKPLGADDRRR